jgi:anti-anti-sigma regulatory factor
VATIIVCDLSTVREANAATVDVLARLQLAARRLGFCISMRGASTELVELLELTGLRDVLLGVEAGGQAEEREDGVGVEEERELGDSAV